MMAEENSELVGAIVNGIERGESPIEIRNSLLNAGYKIEEVNNAFQKAPKDLKSKEEKQALENKSKQIIIPEKLKKSFKFKIIFIVVILLLILGVLGFIFKDIIVEFIDKFRR